ncbi:MAG: lysophospholipid acyltransferase family protein [Phycisphaeraceae bacterium]
MAEKHSRAVIWSQYLAARVVAAGLTSFNVQASLRTAHAAGGWLYGRDHRHRERAKHHLAMAFPEFSDARIEAVGRASFSHLMKLGMEVLHTPRTLHPHTWSQHLEIGDLGPALELLNARKPAILLTGHLGNWEVLGYVLALLGYDMAAIARPLDNPLINRWLLGIREKRGLEIITKFNATDRMLYVLRHAGALGFIADQNAGDKGLFVPYFGWLASTYKSIGLLAMRCRVPIVCGYAHRKSDDFQYEVGVQDIIRPEDWASRPDPLYYITARYARAIEQMVRRRPEQYLWMHRRWKSRPRHERAGEAMPGLLREKIEALPWMDEATLRRLQEPVRAAAEVTG